nr:EOG090X0AJ3 [Lepidurus arcticus]
MGDEGGTGSVSSLTSSSSNEGLGGPGPSPNTPTTRTSTNDKYSKFERLNEADVNADNRFLYVLSASTSIASKVNEETLTYLNQGQSYEIKLKKLGDLSGFRGKYLKSVVRLCFHERRLQYMEREQIAAWRQTRPGDRIVEVDVPLSYGIYDVMQDLQLLNVVEFVWDPTKEVGVYIKINCIGTEFTPKKHGGEKGVPFRLQVETYAHGDEDGTPKRLHVAACQIKVFKLKGADRKHKQDKEKLLKRPVSEQEKYQPSCVCTVLSEVPLDSVYSTVSAPPVTASIPTTVATVSTVALTNATPAAGRHYSGEYLNDVCHESSPAVLDPDGTDSPVNELISLPSVVSKVDVTFFQSSIFSGNPSIYQFYLQSLPVDANVLQTAQWLQSNRFQSLTRTFAHFAGPDILRLSRDDLIQICGLADGIRLFNALHAKALTPRLTLYLSYLDSQPSAFHAIYLESLTSMELMSKISVLVQGGGSSDTSLALYTQGPSGIHVIVTDEVVHNLKDESIWTLEVNQSDDGNMFRVLLKPAHAPEM